MKRFLKKILIFYSKYLLKEKYEEIFKKNLNVLFKIPIKGIFKVLYACIVQFSKFIAPFWSLFLFRKMFCKGAFKIACT